MVTLKRQVTFSKLSTEHITAKGCSFINDNRSLVRPELGEESGHGVFHLQAARENSIEICARWGRSVPPSLVLLDVSHHEFHPLF